MFFLFYFDLEDEIRSKNEKQTLVMSKVIIQIKILLHPNLNKSYLVLILFLFLKKIFLNYHICFYLPDFSTNRKLN